MIPFKKSVISLLASALLIPALGFGQNIYDESHSREFARYLMQTHQFSLASDEWERIVFLNPGDTLARINQLKSLRLGQLPIEGLDKLSHWFPAGPLPGPFAVEGIQLALMTNDFQKFDDLLERSVGLPESQKTNFRLGAWLLEGSWIDEPIRTRNCPFAQGATDNRLLELQGKTLLLPRRSPAAAVALSAIVPGMGKIYAHDWKDGLLSLLFVATNAWQSYRGFSKNGVNSVTGWIFGTLAVGFYSANLFGSWKSASDYNTKQADLIRHETEHLLYTR